MNILAVLKPTMSYNFATFVCVWIGDGRKKTWYMTCKKVIKHSFSEIKSMLVNNQFLKYFVEKKCDM